MKHTTRLAEADRTSTRESMSRDPHLRPWAGERQCMMREVCFTAIVASRTTTEFQRAVMQKRRLVAAVTALILLAAGAAVAGPDTSKADPALTALYEEHRAHQATRSSAPFTSGNRLVRVGGDGRGIDAAGGDGVTARPHGEVSG